MTESEAKDFLERFSLDRIGYANGKEVDMERFGYFTEVLVTAMKALSEIQQYRAIGTVEECREARERQRGKKPVEYEDKYYACPVCDNVLMYKWEKYPSQLKDKKCGLPYCLSCGQAISWECDTD